MFAKNDYNTKLLEKLRSGNIDEIIRKFIKYNKLLHECCQDLGCEFKDECNIDEIKNIDYEKLYPKYNNIFNKVVRHALLEAYETELYEFHQCMFRLYNLFINYITHNIYKSNETQKVEIFPKNTITTLNINKDMLKTITHTTSDTTKFIIISDDEDYQYFIDKFYEKFMNPRVVAALE